MANTLPCPYCKLEVPQIATVCPHCTNEIETIDEDHTGRKMLLIGLVLGLFLPPFVSVFTGDFKVLMTDYYFGKDWWLYWILIPAASAGGLRHAYVRFFRMSV